MWQISEIQNNKYNYDHSQLCPPGRRFLAMNLAGEDLLQIVLLPAVNIRHEDSVLIMGDHLDHLRGGILLVILTCIGVVRVWGSVRLLGVALTGIP